MKILKFELAIWTAGAMTEKCNSTVTHHLVGWKILLLSTNPLHNHRSHISLSLEMLFTQIHRKLWLEQLKWFLWGTTWHLIWDWHEVYTEFTV